MRSFPRHPPPALVVAAVLVARAAGGEQVTFAQAVERALATNPQALAGEAEARRAEAGVEQVRAQSLPTVVGTGSYTRLDAERRLGDRVAAGQDQLSANVAVSVPLVAFGRWAQWSRAKESARVSRAQVDDVRRQVAVATARAYLSSLGQKRLLAAAERARDVAREHVTFASQRYAGGVGNRLDELRAGQELAASEAQVEAAAGAQARLKENLGVLVGAEGPVDVAEEPTLEGAPDETDSVAESQERRYDVKAAKARVEAAQASLGKSWADYAPLLVGVFQPFAQDPPSLVQPKTGWQAQLVLTLPFYDGGLRYGLRKERQATVDLSRAQAEGLLRQARSEVRVAFAQILHADEALAAARRSATLSAQALELANEAYRAGSTTNLEVIDAERRARDASTTVAVAEDAARQARLDLLVAAGRFP